MTNNSDLTPRFDPVGSKSNLEPTLCSVIRCGSSKGVFFSKEDIGEIDNQFMLSVMGSHSENQVDGLGNGYPQASKIAIISKSTTESIDIDFTFLQIGVTVPEVSTNNNCGNMAAGAVLYALHKKIIVQSHADNCIRVFNTNTEQLIETRVPRETLLVPGKAHIFEQTYVNPIGLQTGAFFPTSNRIDRIRLDGDSYIEVTIVDSANLYAFVCLRDIVQDCEHIPDSSWINSVDMARIGALREAIVERLVEAGAFPASLRERYFYSLKVALIASPDEFDGTVDEDIFSMVVNAEQAHNSHPITGSISLTVTTLVRGTLPNKAVRNRDAGLEGSIQIRHPSGVFSAAFACSEEDPLRGVKVTINTSTRLILDGEVYMLA